MFIEPDSQRKFTRIHFKRHVSLEFISDRYDNCRIKNLSLAGMFVIGNFQQQVDKCCNIYLIKTGVSTELSLQAQAKVVRNNDEGIAIEFTSMPFDSYMFLRLALLDEAEDSLVSDKILAENCPFEVIDDMSISP